MNLRQSQDTGVYGNELQLFCEKKGIALCLESPLQIKRSMGLVRGKDDQIDAIRIAQYAYDHKDKLKLFHRPSGNIITLANLLRERRLYVRQKATFLTLAVQNDDFLLTAIYQVVIRSGKVFWVNRSTFSYLCKYVCTQKEESFRQHQRGGDRQKFGQT